MGTIHVHLISLLFTFHSDTAKIYKLRNFCSYSATRAHPGSFLMTWLPLRKVVTSAWRVQTISERNMYIFLSVLQYNPLPKLFSRHYSIPSHSVVELKYLYLSPTSPTAKHTSSSQGNFRSSFNSLLSMHLRCDLLCTFEVKKFCNMQGK